MKPNSLSTTKGHQSPYKAIKAFCKDCDYMRRNGCPNRSCALYNYSGGDEDKAAKEPISDFNLHELILGRIILDNLIL